MPFSDDPLLTASEIVISNGRRTLRTPDHNALPVLDGQQQEEAWATVARNLYLRAWYAEVAVVYAGTADTSGALPVPNVVVGLVRDEDIDDQSAIGFPYDSGQDDPHLWFRVFGSTTTSVEYGTPEGAFDLIETAAGWDGAVIMIACAPDTDPAYTNRPWFWFGVDGVWLSRTRSPYSVAPAAANANLTGRDMGDGAPVAVVAPSDAFDQGLMLGVRARHSGVAGNYLELTLNETSAECVYSAPAGFVTLDQLPTRVFLRPSDGLSAAAGGTVEAYIVAREQVRPAETWFAQAWWRVREALQVVGVESIAAAWAAGEAVACDDAAVQSARWRADFSEDFTLGARIVFGAGPGVSEALNAAEDVQQMRRILAVALEAALFGAPAVLRTRVLAGLAETVSVATVGRWAATAAAMESATASDGFAVRLRAALIAPELIGVAASVSASLVAVVACDEAVALATMSPVKAVLRALAADGVVFAGRVPIEAEDYSVLVLNTETLAPSTYGAFPFGAFARHGDAVYASAADGVYRLGGSTDDGASVDAVLRTGLRLLGDGRQVSVPRAYMIHSTDGELVLKTIAVVRGAREVRHYRVRVRDPDAPNAGLVRFARGVSALLWGFELQNVGGADFEVEALSVYPVVLKRRM